MCADADILCVYRVISALLFNKMSTCICGIRSLVPAGSIRKVLISKFFVTLLTYRCAAGIERTVFEGERAFVLIRFRADTVQFNTQG